MNIYVFELKQLRKSILIWGITVPAVLFLYLGFFPLMAVDTEGFQAMMDIMPEEMLAIFNMQPELPVSTILGYFSLTYTMIQIPLAIQAANYGFNMLSVEERELTADFLLSKPVKRSKIIIAKFLAAFTALTIVNVLLWIATLLAILLFKAGTDVDFSLVVALLSTNVFFQLFFTSVGMFISMILKKIPSVISFSMGLGFGLFILTSMGSLISNDIIQLISPYSHYDPGYILVEGSYDWPLVLLSFSIIIISLGGSYFLYLRRNIPSL